MTTTDRTVFFVSDGTAITAETFGTAILQQFRVPVQMVRMPFVDTPAKAQRAVQRINAVYDSEGLRPIVFSTLVEDRVRIILEEGCKGQLLDMFRAFVQPLEDELGVKSTGRAGRFPDITRNQAYHDRIDAINFSLAHDDGQSSRNLADADVILVGVSRSGKTPTSIYLSMQFGIKVANYPLIPEDFERQQLPEALLPHRGKIFGLTISPERLSEIRSERRPDSRYASLGNCRWEITQSESMMRRYGIHWLSTTTKSIEEIATTVLQDVRLKAKRG